MKVSELMIQLQKVLVEHGDVPVVMSAFNGVEYIDATPSLSTDRSIVTIFALEGDVGVEETTDDDVDDIVDIEADMDDNSLDDIDEDDSNEDDE